MKYTLVFIFSQNMNEVLMMHKTKGPYPGCLNGVGGKIEDTDLNIFAAAYREIEEETGLSWLNGDIESLYHLVTEIFPGGTELNVFYTKITDPKRARQMEEEKIEWFDASNLLDVKKSGIAGEGNIPYFLHYSRVVEKTRKGM